MSVMNQYSVERIADRMAIQDVMYKWCRAIDRLDFDGIRAVFHADAIDSHGAYVGGVEGLIEWIRERHKPIPFSSHQISNMLIEFATPDLALVETYVRTLQRYPAEAKASLAQLSGGQAGKPGVGMDLQNFIDIAIASGLQGIEWASGIPGTLGGAVRGNAGAFGGEIKDSVVEVEFLDNQNKVRKFSNKNCAFSYRSSIFKKKSFIILSVIIKFQKGDRNKLSKVAKSHIIYRRTKHPLNYPNAGSIFKNCDFKKAPKAIKKRFLSVVKKDPFPIIPTALVILEAGLSGKRVGNAQISKKHSNYIVNLGGAKASDVKKLIKIVKDTVKNKFNLVLEEEIQII